MGAIHREADGSGVVTLRLRNEERRNALDDPMMANLAEAFLAGEQLGTRLFVVRGAGGTFCAGRDVAELADADTDRSDPIAPVERLFHAFADCSVPIVAAVEGKAVGLGVALTTWCDFAIAETGATFAVPEAWIGVPPSFTAVSLDRAIGRRAALEMILTGRTIAAEEAHGLGLVQAVYPADGLEDALRSLGALVVRNSPAAIRASRQLLREAADRSLGEAIAQAAALARRSAGSPDQREGLAAFRERRAPRWQ